jgi:membrane protein implicated in regulation of membrane protease activity
VAGLMLALALIQAWLVASRRAAPFVTICAIAGGLAAAHALRKRWAQRASVVILAVALIWAGYLAYDRFRPKSDRERIEEVCGPHASEGSEPAFVGDDGTVSCGGLGSTTESA